MIGIQDRADTLVSYIKILGSIRLINLFLNKYSISYISYEIFLNLQKLFHKLLSVLKIALIFLMLSTVMDRIRFIKLMADQNILKEKYAYTLLGMIKLLLVLVSNIFT